MSGNPNYDSRFNNNFYYLVDSDFTQDGKLIPLEKDKQKIHVVLIFATWCGYCQPAKAEYLQLFNKIDKSKVNLCLINASSNKGQVPTSPDEMDLMKRIKDIVPDFKGLPHFIVMKPSKEGLLEYAETHKGTRTAESLMDTLKKYM